MNVLIKLTSRKILLVCTVLLLTACGGSESSRDARLASTDLQRLADNSVAQAVVVVPTGFNSNEIASAALSAAAGQPVNAGLPGIADVYIGTIDLPYYFDTSNSTTSFWHPALIVRETLTVPLMMTLPNANSGQTMPAAGWPIVMYQHGITRNRTDVIAYADAQAQAGFAVIAIDLPTHGVVDATNPFNAINSPFPTDVEQTFGANVVSGQNFINLPSLLTSRDNLRQGAANLITLRKSLGNIANIDTSRVGLIAHSLGGMVAIPYLAVETTSTPSSIVMSGATITQVLQESASFGPALAAGLAGLGVTSPADVDAFYANAQEIVDAGEPANYAAAAAANHPIHLIEVLGDQTVPNSSTENLVAIMGANSISTTTPGIAAGNTGIVRFTEGAHSSPLSTAASPAATFEIQGQLAAFQATNGTTIVITNGNVIQ